MDDTINENKCSPFWGLIKQSKVSSPVNIDRVYSIVSLDSKVEQVDFFNRFRSVANQALHMLKRRSVEDMEIASIELQEAIQNEIQYLIKKDTEDYIQRLCTRGGWELGYLPYESRGTESEIRELLENWSSEWDDKPYLPKPEDYSELEILDSLVDAEWEDNLIYCWGLAEPDAHEFFALLALMEIGQAVHLNAVAGITRAPVTTSFVRSIGIHAINTVEAIERAHRRLLEQDLNTVVSQRFPIRTP